MENLAKQVKILKIYAGALTLAVLVLAVYMVTLNKGTYKELTAERLNIVEKDGTLRMVISNKARQHPGRMDSKDLPTRERPAGMIFFNDQGDEDGGIVYDGDKNSASMTYSIDQWKNDQIMQLQYAQGKNDKSFSRSYGLKLWERDDQFTLTKQIAFYDSLKRLKDTAALNAGLKKMKDAGRQRLFVGKNTNGEVGLFLSDSTGKPRLNIYINKQSQPVIEKLNDKGEVVK